MSLAFLIQMAWKSALIAGAALIALRLLRSRSAADRAAMLQLAVGILLLLPAVALLLPSLQVASPLPASPAMEPTPPEVWTPPPPAAGPEPAGPPLPARPYLAFPALLAAIYVGGALLLLMRTSAGLVTLARWTAGAAPVTAPEWMAGFARAKSSAGVKREVRLLASDRIGSPLSWGLLRPVILIDRGSLARAADVDAILAHETAHVARHDWLVLMLARLALALFWFNPLVWRLERALVQAAEEAADRQAIERVEPLAYASTLVACIRHAGKAGWALPANGMAPRLALKARVEAILDPKQRGRASGSAATAVAMGLCVLVAGPVAALELVEPAPAAPPAPPRALAKTKTAPKPPARPTPGAPATTAARPADAAPDPDPSPNPEPTPAWEIALDQEIEEAIAGTEVRIPAIRVPEIRIPEVRVPAITIPEQHVRLSPVDREAVREATRAGREAARARREAIRDAWAAEREPRDDARKQERERLQDAREAERERLEDAREAEEAQRERLAAERIFGITAEGKQAYADLGYRNLPQKQLVAMAIHGVTPGFIHDMADAGYPGLSADMLVQMRIFGVTPAIARRAAQTRGRPPPEDLIKMKIFGTL